jgi:hypothetical protein
VDSLFLTSVTSITRMRPRYIVIPVVVYTIVMEPKVCAQQIVLIVCFVVASVVGVVARSPVVMSVTMTVMRNAFVSVTYV